MIPKVIHCVWLSGENKPEELAKCVDSWKKYMPDFEIKEWTTENLPESVLSHPFVNSAISERKWAFATDYIRAWALYNFGGIYLDLDVEVFKSFTPFLAHRAFSCIEFNPRNFYRYLNKRNVNEIRGLNIEAAVLGSEQHHPWIKDMMHYYDALTFSSKKNEVNKLIMPLIVTKVSIPYGFRYIPIYQLLENDIHIYPPDTFSSCYDMSILRDEVFDMGNNVVRYSCHRCAHSWYEKSYDNCSFSYKLKHLIVKIFGLDSVKKIKKIFNKKNIIFNRV